MKAPLSMRIWFIFMGTVLWVGIYLTGFSTASWLLYVPAVGFVIAGVTGICPSQIAAFKIFRSQKNV
ncbi:hypothetical protein [Pinibacter soli]|uniref:DUF2892 domain-containing protein n=1 Tax=Pinibacter soli TaxID=3044211 RepID=A0ABT6RBS8_9BACT|nr:hypothetical protein [Pinibacter soli]MDI3319379.1 hypothetical protein [Pinibacter soli]